MTNVTSNSVFVFVPALWNYDLCILVLFFKICIVSICICLADYLPVCWWKLWRMWSLAGTSGTLAVLVLVTTDTVGRDRKSVPWDQHPYSPFLILCSYNGLYQYIYMVYFHRFPQTISSHLWYPVHPHPHPIIARPLRTTRARVLQPETSKPQGFFSTAIVLTFDWAHYSLLNILSLSDQKSLSLRNLYYHWNWINPS